MIRKVAIRNYRLFYAFDLELSPGVNILVGKNDAGKSTLLEAINLALTGRLHGRPIEQGMSPYLINRRATLEYIKTLRASRAKAIEPPEVIIDIFLEESESTALLRGTNNVHNEDACGVRFQSKLSPDFREEYDSFVQNPDAVQVVPTEYYSSTLIGFHGSHITARSVPLTTSVIDPSTIRLQSGVDYHLQQIIKTSLEPRERVELSRQYRSLREEFSQKDSVVAINARLTAEDDALTDRKLSLSIDLSQRYTWESSLAAHLDDLPFHLIGKGDQSAVKTLLAIGRRVDDTNVILIEEPENHLTFSSLRRLIHRVEERCRGKQLV